MEMALESLRLEEEAIKKGNSLLVQYFEEQDYWLKFVTLSQVPPSLKYEVAILFYISTKDMDWMAFASELGLKNDIVLNAIECKSRTGIPALYLVFQLLPQKSFADIMKQFSKEEKFHILRHVKPYVEDLASNKKNLVQPSAPPFCQESGHPTSNPEGSRDNFASLLQKNCRISIVKEKLKVGLPKPTTVFIQHALSDEDAARKLFIALRNSNMMVIRSKDIFPFLRINHTQILKDLNEKVDFIVPIISEELWKQIGPRKSKVESEGDFETKTNKFLHNLVSHEYFNTQKNFRVRPVIDPSKFKVPVVRDPLLSCPFQLWKEVQSLIEELKVAKTYFR